MSLPVVYIDDEPALCKVFKLLLDSEGREVVTFTEPEAAVAYLEENEVALVFCDHRMPKLAGVGVLEAFVRAGRTAPFYLVSGDLDTSSLEAVPGLTGVIAKPFRAEDLLALIARHAGGGEESKPK